MAGVGFSLADCLNLSVHLLLYLCIAPLCSTHACAPPVPVQAELTKGKLIFVQVLLCKYIFADFLI